MTAITRDVTKLLDPLVHEAQRIDDALTNVVDAVRRMQAAQSTYNDATRASLCSLQHCNSLAFKKGSDIGTIVAARLAQLLGVGSVDVAQVVTNLKNMNIKPEYPLATIARRDLSLVQNVVNGVASASAAPTSHLVGAFDKPPPRAA